MTDPIRSQWGREVIRRAVECWGDDLAAEQAGHAIAGLAHALAAFEEGGDVRELANAIAYAHVGLALLSEAYGIDPDTHTPTVLLSLEAEIDKEGHP